MGEEEKKEEEGRDGGRERGRKRERERERERVCLTGVLAFCPLPCLSRAKTVFIEESVMARRDGEEIVRGAVTGVDLLRQGRIRI